jgi:hypothetical protein
MAFKSKRATVDRPHNRALPETASDPTVRMRPQAVLGLRTNWESREQRIGIDDRSRMQPWRDCRALPSPRLRVGSYSFGRPCRDRAPSTLRRTMSPSVCALAQKLQQQGPAGSSTRCVPQHLQVGKSHGQLSDCQSAAASSMVRARQDCTPVDVAACCYHSHIKQIVLR